MSLRIDAAKPLILTGLSGYGLYLQQFEGVKFVTPALLYIGFAGSLLWLASAIRSTIATAENRTRATIIWVLVLALTPAVIALMHNYLE